MSSIINECSLKATIQKEVNLSGSLSVYSGPGLGPNSKECEPYLGSYEIVPEVKEKTIPTFDKHMIKDLKIKEIPTYKVDNDKGGQTMIIGG